MPCNAAHCMAAETPPPPTASALLCLRVFPWTVLFWVIKFSFILLQDLAGCKSLLSDHGNQCLNLSQWNPSSVPNNYYCHERSKEVIWSRNCLQVDEHFLLILLLFCRSEMNDEESKRVLKMLESNVRFWLNRKNLLLAYFWINEPNKLIFLCNSEAHGSMIWKAKKTNFILKISFVFGWKKSVLAMRYCKIFTSPQHLIYLQTLFLDLWSVY